MVGWGGDDEVSGRMKIVSVECILLSAPYRHADYLRSASFVRITTDSGAVGIGETYAGVKAPLVAKAIVDVLAPTIIGEDALAIQRLWRKLVDATHWTQNGIGMGVISGIEMALWDLKGKHLGVPVYELLGGLAQPTVRLYASTCPGYWPLPAVHDEVERCLDLGYDAIKVRLGFGTFAEDVARAEAAHKMLDGRADVAFDAGRTPLLEHAWSVGYAARMLQALEPFDPLFFEEPTYFEDLDGYRAIREATSVPVAMGERFTNVAEFERALDAEAMDIAQPDTAWLGGIMPFLEVARRCERRRVPVAAHGFATGVSLAANFHACLANPTCTIAEFPELLDPLRDEVLVEPRRMEGGCLLPPTAPGLGVELSEALIERYPYVSGTSLPTAAEFRRAWT